MPVPPPERGTEFYNRNRGAQNKNFFNLNIVTAYVMIFTVPMNSNRVISLYTYYSRLQLILAFSERPHRHEVPQKHAAE